jgi:hypothetical protein
LAGCVGSSSVPIVVGEKGGLVKSSDEMAKVVIPAMAVSDKTAITVDRITDTPYGTVGDAYEFSPDGTHFARPATITISYDETTLPEGVDETRLTLGYMVGGRWKAVTDATVDSVTNTVTGRSVHFSRFGVFRAGSRTIGVEGGEIESGDGKAGIVVQSNTVSVDTTFTIDPVSDVPEGHMGLAYRLRPDGLRLARPAILSIAYDPDVIPLGVDEVDLALGTLVNDQWQILAGGEVNVVTNRVRGSIVQGGPFNAYSVVVRPSPTILSPAFESGASAVKDLIPGRSYTVTGLLRATGNCCVGQAITSFGVAVDGQIIFERSRPLKGQFVPFTTTFLATASRHTVSFIAERNGVDVAYVVDDIAITPKRGFNLMVKGLSAGGGVVTSNPPGIDCSFDCSTSFTSGAGVTLIAEAKQGFVFSGWSGEGCTGMWACALTMDASKAVTAVFSHPSQNAVLSSLVTVSPKSYGEGRLEPKFRPEVKEYTVSRLERGFIDLMASAESQNASVVVGEDMVSSGQWSRIYFDGTDVTLPVVVTAQDGKTMRGYTVRLCQWYCIGTQKGSKNSPL